MTPMHLDLRWPLGWLFTTLGVILVIHGLVVGTRVMGINVNLVWGAAMVLFGGVSLYLARLNASR